MRIIDKVIRGLTIIAKYEGAYICAEHDQVHAGMKSPHDISDLDLRELDSLGWDFDAYLGNWSRSV
jgi:hypothetical protein